jgi:UDP:flavonoid glycosyltransferase YjiC (YdhE family)
MRILFSFIGGLGHFDPLEPVAHACVAAGHEVAVACSGGLTARIEARGFPAFATSAPRSAAGPATRDLTPLDPVDAHAAEVEFAENFAGKGARRHAVAVQEHLVAWSPDVVVHDEADFGAAIAAEVRGVPSASVLVLASGLLVRPDLVAPPLAALRADHGLAPDPGLTMLARGPVLSPFPASFRSPDSPVPLPETTFAFRGSPVITPVHRGPLDRRRVYATLGTVFNSGSGDLFERLLAGLGLVEAEVVVTVGTDVDPAAFGPQPGHVRVEAFVPQAELLPTVDLVVSHGGSGTLMATLAHGLPSVLLPLGADQPHNAARARELGVARVLDAATATPDQIRDAVEDAVQDRDALQRARQVAAEYDALPPVDQTVPLLEQLRTPTC